MIKTGAIVGAVLATFVLVVFPLGPFTAIGAPSKPGIQLNVPLNPAISQTIQILVTTNVYSVQSPNSIDLLGDKIVYSAWAGATNIAFKQSAALGILSSSGTFPNTVYTLSQTLSFTIGAGCAASNCPGAVTNFSIQVQAQVSTYFAGTLFSPWANVSFTNNGQTGGTNAAPAPTNAYYFQIVAPLTLAVGIDLILFGIVGPKWIILPGIGAVVISFLEWVVLMNGGVL